MLVGAVSDSGAQHGRKISFTVKILHEMTISKRGKVLSAAEGQYHSTMVSGRRSFAIPIKTSGYQIAIIDFVEMDHVLIERLTDAIIGTSGRS